LGLHSDDLVRANSARLLDLPWRLVEHGGELHYFLAFAGALLGFPAFIAAVLAVDSATAMACFWGIPAFISLPMFLEIDFWE
jgi:hypothetical protein